MHLALAEEMKKTTTVLILFLLASCSQKETKESEQQQSMKNNKLVAGDRIHLFGGYDFEPKWLRNSSGYDAMILRFIDNGIEGRKGDERLSAIIKFDDELEFDGLVSRYGLMMGRWENQEWINEGVVHLHLTAREIEGIDEFTEESAKWMESHADYKKI